MAEADPLEHRLGGGASLGLRRPADLRQPDHHVAERGQVREQVEALEDHADVGALASERGLGHADEPAAAGVAHADPCAVEVDLAGVDRLKQRQAAQQRALARPRRTQDRLDLAALDPERHAAEHLVAAVPTVHPDGLEHRAARRARVELGDDVLVEDVPRGGFEAAHRAAIPRRMPADRLPRACEVQT